MRTLVSYLNEKTPQALKAIAELWEANLTDRLVSGNTFQLALEMQSEFLQRRLLEKLDADQLKLLALFVSRPSEIGLSLDNIRAKDPDLTPDQLNPALLRLRQFGLLHDDRARVADPKAKSDPFLTLPNPARSLNEFDSPPSRSTPRQAVQILPRELTYSLQRLVNERLASLEQAQSQGQKISRLPLEQLLGRLELDLLVLLAESWAADSLMRRDEVDYSYLAKEVAAALSDKSRQQKVLDSLPPDSQELFAQMRRSGGRTTITRLREKFVTLRRLGQNLRPLTEHLLVWEVFENGESLVFIPAEILNPLQSASEPPPLALQTVAEPGNATTFPTYALAWDILTFLNYLGQTEVELTTQHYIPKRHQKKLNMLFWVNEDLDSPFRFAFLTLLTSKQELYTRESYSERLLPGSGLDEWLQLDLYEQSRRLFKLWQDNPYYSSPVSYPYYYGSAEMVDRANKAIVGWLANCQAGVWYSLDSFLHKIRQEEPFFVRSRRDLVKQYGLKRVEEMVRQWPEVEGEMIRSTLGTFLEWLGVVRLGRNEAGAVVAFALTDLGAELVGAPGAVSPVLPTAEKPLLVQPNFEIMLFVPQVNTLWTLLKFTNLKKLDLVSLYTLDRPALVRGLELGLTAPTVLEWLGVRNPQPLPQNLIVSVQDWSKGFHRVMVERTTLLEVDDPKVLDELMRTKEYAEYFVRRISPNAAVIKLTETKESYLSHRDPRTDPLRLFKNKLKGGGFFAT